MSSKRKGKGKGKAKEVVGWLTADRQVEAEGRVEQDAADPATEEDQVTSEDVAEETDSVREEYGELVTRSDDDEQAD